MLFSPNPEQSAVTTVKLEDRLTGQTTGADVVLDVPLEGLIETEMRWLAYRFQALLQKNTGLARVPESAHWNWVGKRKCVDESEARVIGLRVEGAYEGLMMTALKPVPSRNAEAFGKPLLFVKFLETAPTNLRGYVGNKARFGAVGAQLLRVAVALSIEMGCEGRLGLESLPQAREFYKRMRFDDLGLGGMENLTIFELSEINARMLLEGTYEFA